MNLCSARTFAVRLAAATLLLTACVPEPLPTRVAPTAWLPPPASTPAETPAVTMTAVRVPTPAFTVEPQSPHLPFVEAPVCDWSFSTTPAPFTFEGQLLLMSEAARFGAPSAPRDLWRISKQTPAPQLIGRYDLGTERYLGPQIRLSPGGQWLLTTTSWEPETEPPPPVLVTATDLSQSFLVHWDTAWDATLGWWDDTHLVVLPANGNTADIFLLNIVTQENSPLPVVQNAVYRAFVGSSISKWRSKWGVEVSFNHRLSQVIHFALSGSAVQIQLSDVSDSKPLWAFSHSGAFSYYSSLEGAVLWSPGDVYAAIRLGNGSQEDLFLVSPTGVARQVADFTQEDANQVFIHLGAWSAQGNRLAFEATLNLSEAAQSRRLYILDLDRAEVRQMCAEVDSSEFVWSPDGKYLAIKARRDVNSNVSPVVIVEALTGAKWLVDASQDWHIIGWVHQP